MSQCLESLGTKWDILNCYPDQFLQLENIKMMEKVCAGGYCTFLVGASAVSPIIDIRKDSAKTKK